MSDPSAAGGAGPGGVNKDWANNKDIFFAAGIVVILLMLFVPLPPMLLDFGLAISLSLSILILMVALWIPRPLDFNSFPTLLLVVTMLRLALNISSTRLILSEGHTGTSAAGDVIEGFSQFIVGGDYVLGVVLFAILVVINFMVITKGATRIAEVQARFTLDSKPGDQMAIDADLGAGSIDEAEAKRRRQELQEDSQFFGAMDGASKFVRGDAVAGIIITLINIVGGIIIGVMQHGLSVGQAASNYTVLTIGDGLVTQIPALIVSLAAGLIVTKGGTVGAVNEAVLHQLGDHPRAIYMAAALLSLMGLLPGFPFFVFVLLGAGLASLGYFMKKRRDIEKMREEAQEEEDSDPYTAYSEETPEEILKLDDLRLELGGALIPLISSTDAALPGKVRSLRKFFAKEFGFILPFMRIQDDVNLPGYSYSVVIQGVSVATGEVRPTSMMVIDPMNKPITIEGEKTREPTFGLNAVWINPARSEEAESAGYTVVDPENVITTHLTEVIKEHMPSLLTYGATQDLVDGLDRKYQKLVNEMSTSSPVVLLQRVLQNLLAERVSVRNLPLIVESISEAASQSNSQNIVKINEHVRQKLSNQICQSLASPDGFIDVIVMSAEWDDIFLSHMNRESGELELNPQRVEEFVFAARKVVQEFGESDMWPALLVHPDLRPYVRTMLERICPMTPVISHNELHRSATVKTVGKIGD